MDEIAPADLRVIVTGTEHSIVRMFFDSLESFGKVDIGYNFLTILSAKLLSFVA